MKRKRRRKCNCCGVFYQPDHRTRDRQRYCSLPHCRERSHAESQRRWLAKPANRDYFRGPEHLQRMRLWREKHPGYWKSRLLVAAVVHDDCSSQPLAPQQVQLDLAGLRLQDDCPMQIPLIVGLISNLTGHTLQDDIARSLRQFHNRGQQILGGTPITTAGSRLPESLAKGDLPNVKYVVLSTSTHPSAAPTPPPIQTPLDSHPEAGV